MIIDNLITIEKLAKGLGLLDYYQKNVKLFEMMGAEWSFDHLKYVKQVNEDIKKERENKWR